MIMKEHFNDVLCTLMCLLESGLLVFEERAIRVSWSKRIMFIDRILLKAKHLLPNLNNGGWIQSGLVKIEIDADIAEERIIFEQLKIGRHEFEGTYLRLN